MQHPPELVCIERGEFQMGTMNPYFPESPVHTVRITQRFYLGKYPITQRQWLEVMGDTPATFKDCLDCPVESVSWDQAVAFCGALTKALGRAVRLPSEAEWEYACRAGTSSDYFFGAHGPFTDESEISVALTTELSNYAWFEMNSRGSTHPVGMKQANPWGLHDMVGNVWEWCSDTWHSDYEGGPSDGSAWLADAQQQPRRCLRGGAWDMDAFRCRSAYRSYDHRTVATSRFGLRILIDG